MGVRYCTREDVQSALDFKETARNATAIDNAIESASRFIDGHTPGGGLLHRRFYPEIDTRYFDWPNDQYARPWRLWLGAHELISVTSIVSGGVTLSSGDYFLRPDHGPPYGSIEIDLADSAAWNTTTTHQRAISVTGVFGFCADGGVAGATAEALDASETGVDVTDSAAIGVGDLIKADSEWMQVTGKSMLTTAQTTGGTLTAANSDVTVAVQSGAAFNIDETILIDSEKMRVVDIAGNNLIVRRAHDGSVLAAHSAAVTIYAPRTLTVVRAAVGTTAATHLTAAPLTRNAVPGPVRELAVAMAANTMLQRAAGYARTAGSGDNEREARGLGVNRIIEDVYATYGRKNRIDAI